MKTICLMVITALFLVACSRGSARRIFLKADGKDLVLDVKSGVMRTSQEAHMEPPSIAATYEFTLANFNLDTEVELTRELAKPEETRVFFRLFGEQGTNFETPLKPGTYSAYAQEVPKFDNSSLAIFTFAGDKQSVARTLGYPGADTIGEVRITSVDSETVKGEINVTTRNKLAAKGPFTVKIKQGNF